MATIIFMAILTAAAIFFLAEIAGAGRAAAAEVVLSKAWSYRFARQVLEEKRETYLEQNQKYGSVSDKKVNKKIKAWQKQIDAFQKQEERYFSGQRFTVGDVIPLFGYQVLVDLKLDGDNDFLRKLTSCCEHTGYIELERTQETSGKRNSSIYAYYLLASLFSFVFVGVILSCFLGVITMAAGNKVMGTILPMAAGLAGMALYGYIPYDNLREKAAKRQEEINRGFPNAISKIALLVMAGMNITRALEETAGSGSGLIYRELRLVIKEISQGNGMEAALTRLQCRCDNRYLDKMITIITKSYTSGNANLADDLKKVNDECWLDRKHSARRMGEAVQNKLFIPTMIMFIGILVVIVVPAMSGFGL